MSCFPPLAWHKQGETERGGEQRCYKNVDKDRSEGKGKRRTGMPRKKTTRLLAHEAVLLAKGQLCETTHAGASSRWLEMPEADRDQVRAVTGHAEPLSDVIADSESSTAAGATLAGTGDSDGFELVYRHMGDREFAFLQQTGQLPATQPYQTIVRGEEGFRYCLKYFQGKKKVDTDVTTIVAFAVESGLVETLFRMQSKVEDGAMSHGLGDKGGKGLPLFNAGLTHGRIFWRIRLVKRGDRG